MNADLAQLLGTTREAFAAGMIVFLRVGAAMAVLPAFGEQAVPQRVRLVLGLCFTLIVAPAVLPAVDIGSADQPRWLFWISEPLVGLAFGLALRLMVMALQVAGTMAAQASSLAQMFSGAGVEPQPVTGYLLMMAGLAAAVSMGLHVRVAEALIETYWLFPPGEPPSAGELLGWAIERISAAFALAFALAMPFTIAALIYNVALGVINRAMPHLMVAFVGAPALTAGGLVLLYFATPLMLSVWSEALVRVLDRPF